jgi:hypothetical protein
MRAGRKLVAVQLALARADSAAAPASAEDEALGAEDRRRAAAGPRVRGEAALAPSVDCGVAAKVADLEQGVNVDCDGPPAESRGTARWSSPTAGATSPIWLATSDDGGALQRRSSAQCGGRSRRLAHHRLLEQRQPDARGCRRRPMPDRSLDRRRLPRPGARQHGPGVGRLDRCLHSRSRQAS